MERWWNKLVVTGVALREEPAYRVQALLRVVRKQRGRKPGRSVMPQVRGRDPTTPSTWPRGVDLCWRGLSHLKRSSEICHRFRRAPDKDASEMSRGAVDRWVQRRRQGSGPDIHTTGGLGFLLTFARLRLFVGPACVRQPVHQNAGLLASQRGQTAAMCGQFHQRTPHLQLVGRFSKVRSSPPNSRSSKCCAGYSRPSSTRLSALMIGGVVRLVDALHFIGCPRPFLRCLRC